MWGKGGWGVCMWGKGEGESIVGKMCVEYVYESVFDVYVSGVV